MQNAVLLENKKNPTQVFFRETIMKIGTSLCAVAAAFAFSTAAFADDVKLPGTLAWSAYNTGTTGYNQSVAMVRR